MKLIESKTLATAAASIEFTSIPQTFTDLVVVCALRANASAVNDNPIFRFNGIATNYSYRVLRGTGSATSSYSGGTTFFFLGESNGNSSTSNTFSNQTVYIPNYTASTNKSVSIDSVMENNSTEAYQNIIAGLWSNTAAITSILFQSVDSHNLLAGSTISLYGILKGSDGIVTTSP
jgi:hypothetical protein